MKRLSHPLDRKAPDGHGLKQVEATQATGPPTKNSFLLNFSKLQNLKLGDF